MTNLPVGYRTYAIEEKWFHIESYRDDGEFGEWLTLGYAEHKDGEESYRFDAAMRLTSEELRVISNFIDELNKNLNEDGQ